MSKELIERLRHEIGGWEQAYPLSAFPEPDLKRAAAVLKDAGMTLDAISASNMRHVVSCLAPLIHEAIAALDATPLAEMREENERLREALIEEREENLWNAYNCGSEKDGRWTHMFMSDGEWLAREVGLDPTTGWYEADYIKAAIPVAARKHPAFARAALGGGG